VWATHCSSVAHGHRLVLGVHSHTFFTKLRYVKNLDGKGYSREPEW
jgi:hypothetical protein